MNTIGLKPNIFATLILVIVIIIIYYPVFNNDFIYQWDDQWQVMTQTTEDGLTLDNLVAMFSKPFYNQYFPVNQFFYMLIYSMSDSYNAFHFHLFCVAVHIFNALLVFVLFKQILSLSKRIEISKVMPVSFLTAFIFAIHPLNVESVAWISASKILIYTFFYLLSLYSYVVYVKKRHIYYYLLSLFLFLCSFGGKEQAVILPLCLIIVDWLLRRDLKSSNIWLEKISFLIIAFWMGCITMYFAHGDIFYNTEGYSVVEKIIFACYSYVEYLFKWLFPIKLLYLYPFPFLPNDSIPIWMMAYPILILLVVFSFKNFLMKWPVAFGILFLR